MSEQFWAMLQAGLMSGDSLTRKRAMYLVKRAVDTVTSEPTTCQWTLTRRLVPAVIRS